MPRSKRFKVVTVVAVIGAVGMMAAAGSLIASRQLVASSPAQQVEMRGFPQTFSQIIERVSPAVVSIRVTKVIEQEGINFRNFGWPDNFEIPEGMKRFFNEEFFNRFGPQSEGQGNRRLPRATGAGSGFFIDAEGYLVTNRHVVGDAEKVEVVFKDGKTIEAQVVGTDAKTDLALLKVEDDRAFPYVRFGTSGETKVGDWIIAIGSPFGLGHTATVGIVSARSRDIGAGPYDDFLQIDAPINRGNSGGPTFNLKGEVIGVNTAILSPTGVSAGIGFAIPSDMARDVIEQLKNTGQVARGWLGINIQRVDEDLARALSLDAAQGALVSVVVPDQPASKSDLREGDVIVAVDGTTVDSVGDLPRIISRIPANTEARLTVIRNGERKDVLVTVGAMPEETASLLSPPPKRNVKAGLGLTLGALDDEARRRFNVNPDVEGAVVLNVQPGSQADEKGIRRGDVILQVAGQDISGPSDVAKAAKDALQAGDSDRKRPLLLLLSRNNNTRYLALPLGDG